MWSQVAIGILVAAAVLAAIYGLYKIHVLIENADWKGLFRWIKTGRY